MAWWDTKYPSSPVASTYSDLNEDQDDWGCEAWRAYHERNKQALGQFEANNIIRVDVDNLSWVADIYGCKYDCSFVNYFERELGETVGNIFSQFYCGAETVVTTAHQGVKLLPVILPAAVLTAGFLAFNYAKKNDLL